MFALSVWLSLGHFSMNTRQIFWWFLRNLRKLNQTWVLILKSPAKRVQFLEIWKLIIDNILSAIILFMVHSENMASDYFSLIFQIELSQRHGAPRISFQITTKKSCPNAMNSLFINYFNSPSNCDRIFNRWHQFVFILIAMLYVQCIVHILVRLPTNWCYSIYHRCQ